MATHSRILAWGILITVHRVLKESDTTEAAYYEHTQTHLYRLEVM